MNRKNKLNTIGIEITWNCNQRCSYCYLACSDLDSSFKEEMSLETFKGVLDKIWQYGTREVYLIGGEPTVHDSFSQIVKTLKGFNWERVGICTNGVGISDSYKNLIKDTFDYVSVSVRGSEKTTDKITSKSGSFKETFEFLKLLSNNKKNETRIGLDLLPQYLNEFQEIISLLEDNQIKFDCIEIHRIAPMGKAKDRDVLDLDGYRKVLDKVDKVSKEKGYKISFEDALPLCLFDKKYWKYINTCRCGVDKIWIGPQGEVRRCACSSGAIGNITKISLDDIWNSDRLKEFRSFNWVSDECKKCAVFEKCLGGCASSRGVSFFDLDRFSKFFKSL